MTAHSLDEAKALQKIARDEVRKRISQCAVSSVSMLDDGNWALQFRFPYSITAQERSFLKSLEAESGIVILVEDKVGLIRHLTR